MTFVARIPRFLNVQINRRETIEGLRTRMTECVHYFRMLVGTGPTTSEIDFRFRCYFDALYKLNEDGEIGASLSLWLYRKRHEDGASPIWGNLQDDQELQKFLQSSPSVCVCSTAAASAKCHTCLSQIRSVLDSVSERFAIYDRLLRETANIFEVTLRTLQGNMATGLSEHEECSLCRNMFERFKYSVEHRFTWFLLSHLRRMARITSNFTKNIES